MSLHAARGRLMAVTKKLMVSWQQTSQYWRDSNSSEFEKKYISDLQPGLNRAVKSIGELEKIISKIKHDCE